MPDVFDTAKESKPTLDLYGKSEFAKGCLIARRLVERGVRMVQLSHSISGYDIAWDTGHGDIKGGHAHLARECDQGIAGLIQDLKLRGLLDETLVIWGGEFGRAPTSEGQKGRDHDHYGFTVWMAGGGVKGGQVIGSTNPKGEHPQDRPLDPNDLLATIYRFLGIDHEAMVEDNSGRPIPLIPGGTAIEELL